MLRWCRYYFLTNPLVNAVVYKMAEYPVTDLIIDSENEALARKWTYFFDNVLQFKKFLVECGLDYYTYGNCFISIYLPFEKQLKCASCGKTSPIEYQRYHFRDFEFVGECSRCGHYGVFDVKDHYVRASRNIRLVRWNPENITVHHSDITGESQYFYNIPGTDGNDIRMGKRHVIEKTPQVFIEALKHNRSLQFNPDNIFHMKRPTIAQKDKGWGLPMILPVLKDVFYLQILRKAQEAIALEHIVPLRLLFPQTPTASADVYANVNLTNWRNQIERELIRWRLDNNYIPIMPLPVGQETLGAQGKALSLAQEYRVWSEHIVAGMGVPTEFIYGGLSYSGSNVSMRMLENHFIEDRSNFLKLVLNFIMPAVSAFMGWPVCNAHFRKFKMADDLQRSAFNFQLAQAGKLSDKTMLEELDWDAKEQGKFITEEHQRSLELQRQNALAQASIQGESQLALQKYQIRGQKQMQQAMGPPPGAMPPGAAPGDMPPEMAGPPPGAPPGAMPIDQGQMGQEGPPGAASPLNMSQVGPAAMEDTLGTAMTDPRSADIMALAEKIVKFLDRVPENERAGYLSQLASAQPQLHAVVMQLLDQRGGAHAESQGKPQPEQRPARRGPEAQAA
jgi:hypothetical protein